MKPVLLIALLFVSAFVIFAHAQEEAEESTEVVTTEETEETTEEDSGN